jgi:hypothetical protein
MIAPRLMPRGDWEVRLQKMACKKLEDDSEPTLETGEWWLTEHEFLFPVACDSQGYLRIEDWQQVLILIARLRPLNWDT